MWMHGGVCASLLHVCNWLLTLFPKVFATGVLVWSEHGLVMELYRQYSFTWQFYVPALILLLLFLLSVYTYFQVIRLGAGSPLDYAELRKDNRLANELLNPYKAASDVDANTGSEIGRDGDLGLETPLFSGNQHGLHHLPLEYLVSHLFRNNEPAFRWCNTCQVWKPDRCHHCLTCKQCFLRMDHHCPWFACCIGHRNQKMFLQFLIYATVFSGSVCAVSVQLLYTFFAEAQYEQNVNLLLNLVFLFVVSLAFFCALACFAGFLLYLVLKNYTTIEFQDDKWARLADASAQYEYDANGKRQKIGHLYDLGYARNWRSIMGSSWIHWLLPTTVTDDSSVYALENGLNFEVDEEVFEKYCYNARLQGQLNAQLAEYRDRVRGTTSATK